MAGWLAAAQSATKVPCGSTKLLFSSENWMIPWIREASDQVYMRVFPALASILRSGPLRSVVRTMCAQCFGDGSTVPTSRIWNSSLPSGKVSTVLAPTKTHSSQIIFRHGLRQQSPTALPAHRLPSLLNPQPCPTTILKGRANGKSTPKKICKSMPEECFLDK